MDTIKHQQVMNPHGLLVKKWCKSCQFKIVDNDGLRHCTRRGGRVITGDGCCQMWQMSDGLMGVGKTEK